MTDTLTLPAPGVEDALAAIFEAAGGSGEEARRIAANLVGANLAGHDSHGIVRTQRYVEWAAGGHVRFGVEAEVVTDGGAFALVEGGFGFGQTVGPQAVRLGIERAREHGVALVALRNAGHLGRIGAFAEACCAEGLAFVAFVNVQHSLLVAPFGGAGRAMSTAPVCVGVPEPTGGHFILDFATSKIAEGKALVALRGGKRTPPASLIDGEGRATDDPSVLYGETAHDRPDPRGGPGALAPMGEHKGSGLAMACELLAGCLTGSGAGGKGSHIHNGMLAITIDPARLDDGHGWAEAVRGYLDFARACPPGEGVERVMVAGDPERARREARGRDGLPVSAGVWESILAAGEAVGLERDALERMARGD